MAKFIVKGLSPDGKKTSDIIESINSKQARKIISEGGVMVTDVKRLHKRFQ